MLCYLVSGLAFGFVRKKRSQAKRYFSAAFSKATRSHFSFVTDSLKARQSHLDFVLPPLEAREYHLA